MLRAAVSDALYDRRRGKKKTATEAAELKMRAAKSAVLIVPYGTSYPIIHPTHSEVISLRYMLKPASAAKRNYLREETPPA